MHGVVGCVLHIPIERHLDANTPAVQLSRSDVLLEDLLHLFEKVRRDPGDRAHLGGNLHLLSSVRLRLRDVALTHHQAEDGVAPVRCSDHIMSGIVEVRCADDAGQERRLRKGQGLRGTPEVRQRRRLDAVGAAAEINRVQIQLEDLFLRTAVGQLQRDDRLARLAQERRLVPDEGVLHVLLRDRAAALVTVTEDVRERRARDASDRDPGIAVEGAILGRDDRMLKIERHVAERDRDPIGVAVDRPDQVAVIVEDLGRLKLGDVVRAGDARERVSHEEEKNEQREWSEDEKGHPLLPATRPGKEAEKPAPSAPRSGAPGLSLPFLRDGHSYPGPIPTRESATSISDRSKNFVGVAV